LTGESFLEKRREHYRASLMIPRTLNLGEDRSHLDHKPLVIPNNNSVSMRDLGRKRRRLVQVIERRDLEDMTSVLKSGHLAKAKRMLR
jgi:hypothetical protein